MSNVKNPRGEVGPGILVTFILLNTHPTLVGLGDQVIFFSLSQNNLFIKTLICTRIPVVADSGRFNPEPGLFYQVHQLFAADPR